VHKNLSERLQSPMCAHWVRAQRVHAITYIQSRTYTRTHTKTHMDVFEDPKSASKARLALKKIWQALPISRVGGKCGAAARRAFASTWLLLSAQQRTCDRVIVWHQTSTGSIAKWGAAARRAFASTWLLLSAQQRMCDRVIVWHQTSTGSIAKWGAAARRAFVSTWLLLSAQQRMCKQSINRTKKNLVWVWCCCCCCCCCVCYGCTCGWCWAASKGQ